MQLKELNVSDNELEALPECLQHLKSLATVFLFENRIVDLHPDIIASLKT